MVAVAVLGEWRFFIVCGDDWDMSDAAVVCRELGCGEAVDALGKSHFGSGSGPIWMDDVDCSGSEFTLKKCQRRGWGKHNCNHSTDAGVICSGVLLVNGSRCSGRVEVLHGESWFTVCDADFNQQDAEVVCRELGCGSPVEILGAAAFGRGEGPVWSEELQCRGNESQIHFCPKSSSLKHNCSHDNDVGLVCSEYKEIRLTEGCEGNLEVFYNGTWGNVCNNGMDVETMGLICRELNCGRFKTERATKARVESAPNWLDDVKCRKHDSTLFHCPSSSWSQNNCDRSSEVTHITCSGEKKQLAFENLQKFFLFPNQDYMPIRLRGGEEICSGRLEVYHNAEWGSVCADLWDIRDAQVVCRQLGCGPALSANRRAADGSGGGTIWMNRVKCRGNDIHLWDCPHSLKIHTGCSHSAGVTCADIFVTLPFSSETTTTYTTVPAQLTEKKTVPPSKIPSSNFPYIYPVSLLVLGSVLFLALVLLVVLFYQNRVLRRVISKVRRKTLLEAVYEEINHKCVTNRYTKRGSFISEDQHSGYEDVDEELLSENYGEVYDDIIPAEESPHITTDYDDVVEDVQMSEEDE
ncbi:antigen WC1.1 isoform X7 [Astyanax mexicanus]|uniref:antigen WC1.1 isoform X7 n=1 Tax=Astyanax mexicanus TaxID=7994 RepID=UPI0020CB5307|nr:antigen WC1.1 isoform X7 [Astyanax mexicanus]